jgi:hypothetical protein
MSTQRNHKEKLAEKMPPLILPLLFRQEGGKEEGWKEKRRKHIALETHNWLSFPTGLSAAWAAGLSRKLYNPPY